MRQEIRSPLEKIVSGGQTGADRAALDWALAHGIAAGGWCPRGRRAEDGAIPHRYPLEETPSEDYVERTLWNVRDSDGTVIFTVDRTLSGGSRLTAEEAARLRKPWVHLNGGTPYPAEKLRAFLEEHQIRVLNVAGSRSSREPGVSRLVWITLEEAFFPSFLAHLLYKKAAQKDARGAMGDAIEIRGLWLESRIGITEEERSRAQPLRVSLRLQVGGLEEAARSDQIQETVDYDELAREVRQVAGARPRNLLERLAEEIAAAVLRRPKVKSVSVVLEKFPLPQAEGVAVSLWRDRSESPDPAWRAAQDADEPSHRLRVP
ncbi:YpsA SLOG family protein [Methylacidimicrobium tartarophylax]|uniref:dihydroneopterin aldolase n=1 Tax=Methylacidimicrobium tartarophylax TaxID=1041768 RepID=A0A5E6M818_9BACT|nr:putative molybdenum carrier protein [Methylacidimicrobium tartarophylax]VVM05700.1 Dihydroneopterin aldolase [Methylacidimicrobium tartarophylax]